MKVIWSPLALERLSEREAFLAERSKDKATKTIALLIDKADSLVFMSRRGRRVPEVGDEDLRELVVGDYRLIYEVSEAEQRIEIVTVLHGAQRFPLQEFLDD